MVQGDDVRWQKEPVSSFLKKELQLVISNLTWKVIVISTIVSIEYNLHTDKH